MAIRCCSISILTDDSALGGNNVNPIDNFDFSMSEEGYKPHIAQWKIFSDEEAELAKLADVSFEGKVKYVDFYREHAPEYYDKGLIFIEKAIATFLRQEISEEEHDRLVIDMIYSLHRFGCSFEAYFWFDYPKLNTVGRAAFITDKVRYYLYNKLNLESNYSLFRNKAETYKVFGDYYKRRLIKVQDDEDYEVFVSFANAVGRFMVKQIDGDSGRGAKIIDVRDYHTLREVFAEIRSMGTAILEELIVQDPEMAKLHPDSVNTVRIPVVKSAKTGEVHIFHPYLRTGQGGAVVDNAGAGGILADIDAQTGIVYTPGVDEAWHQYLLHPDTQVKIVGFQIPRWNEVIELVKEISAKTTNRFIAWDMALTEAGWVVVEGNACGQFGMQWADKTGRLQEFLNLI